MATSPTSSELFEPSQFSWRKTFLWGAGLLAVAAAPFLIWPVLADRMLASSFLPHRYCYLSKPGLVWTHVIADTLIGLSYVMISGTLTYLAWKGRRDIPFDWMFLAFGSFIVACGGTHFMEVVTVWVPVYVLSASVKVVTAFVSMATAVLLPFTVPRVLALVQTARASEAAEAKFHQMADNIQEIFWMVDAVTKQAIYVNPAFERITGRGRASLQEAPLSYHEIIHEEDRGRVLSHLDEASRSGSFKEQFRIIRPDGSMRWVEARGFPVRDAQGKIYRLAGVVQDITDHKRADEALRRSEAEAKARAEELTVILDAIPGMAFIARDPACLMITGSRATYDLLRLPHGTNISISAPESERPTNFRLVQDGRELAPAELPFQRAVASGQVVRECEITVVFDDGSARDIFGNAAPLLDQRGEVRGGVGVFVDITDRKRAEEARHKSEERFRLAAQAGKMFAYEWDPDTDEIVRSEESAQMLGVDGAAQMTGREVMTTVLPDDRERLSAALADLSPQHPDLRISYRITRPNGTVIWVDRNSRAHFDPQGRMLRVVGMVTDITERKRAEEALQQAQSELARVIRIGTMGELTASIAHEITQPLAAIVTNGSAALRWLGAQPPNLKEARAALKRGTQEANRAGEVIKRIRALLAKESPQMSPLDVNEVIGDVLALVGDMLIRGGIAAQAKLAAEVQPVLGDRVQLQQVILNLIMNGIDAMSAVADRARELLIKSAAHPEGVLIEVRDSGKGLDLEHADRIFEPFFTTKAQGIGMGLSISRSIVEAHGGRLWATPGDPYGATFRLILPRANGTG